MRFQREEQGSKWNPKQPDSIHTLKKVFALRSLSRLDKWYRESPTDQSLRETYCKTRRSYGVLVRRRKQDFIQTLCKDVRTSKIEGISIEAYLVQAERHDEKNLRLDICEIKNLCEFLTEKYGWCNKVSRKYHSCKILWKKYFAVRSGRHFRQRNNASNRSRTVLPRLKSEKLFQKIL